MKFRQVLTVPIVAAVGIAAYAAMFEPSENTPPAPQSATETPSPTPVQAPVTPAPTPSSSDQKADVPLSGMPGDTFYTVGATPACTSEDQLKVLLALLRAGNTAGADQTDGCLALSAGTPVTYVSADGWMLPWFRVAVTLKIGTVTLWLRAADLRTDLDGAQSGHPLSY
jgi:hypothetical protein